MRFTIALAASVLVLEAGVWSTVVAGGVDTWVGVGGHIILLTMLAASMQAFGSRFDRYRVLLWLSTAAFGPLGPAGVLVAMVLERWHARRATALSEWHEMLFPPMPVDDHADLWRRIGQRASDHGEDSRITPFLDVLAFGAVPQRQAAVAVIAQQFKPAFAPALRAALRDTSNVVRVQAATAIARLEQQSLERTLQLEAALTEAPESATARLALATHYDDQAFGGLLDPTREEQCRLKAQDGYRWYVERHADPGVELRLARLQMRRGDYEDAEPRLRALAAAGHSSATLWLMELLFAERRFAELRAVARAPALHMSQGVSPELEASTGLWAGSEARVV